MKRPTSPKKIVLFIDQYFPEATSSDRADRIIAGQRAASFVTLLDQIEAIPEELLPSDEDDYSLLDLAANDIKAKLKEISTHGDRELKHIPGSGRKNALVEIRRILDNCPTRFIPAEIAGLEFVKDGAYRTILREDLAEFESYLKNREWKAATVLGAALLESILLETLSGMETEAISARAAPKHKGKVVQDLTDRAWTLAPFFKSCEGTRFDRRKTYL